MDKRFLFQSIKTHIMTESDQYNQKVNFILLRQNTSIKLSYQYQFKPPCHQVRNGVDWSSLDVMLDGAD